MLREIRRIFAGRKITFDFKSSALLILDMQNFFLTKTLHAFIPSANAIVPNLQKLISLYHKHSRPVVFTRHENTPKNSVLMHKFWKNILGKGELNQITDTLNTKNSVIIKKTQYDAFYKTRLEKLLKQTRIKHLLITGVMTNLCCETTVRSAFMKGFMPFFPADTTAAYNENLHKASLLNISHGFGRVDTIENILKPFFNTPHPSPSAGSGQAFSRKGRRRKTKSGFFVRKRKEYKAKNRVSYPLAGED
jgi:isochorismate hydrolase